MNCPICGYEACRCTAPTGRKPVAEVTEPGHTNRVYTMGEGRPLFEVGTDGVVTLNGAVLPVGLGTVKLSAIEIGGLYDVTVTFRACRVKMEPRP